MGHTYESLWNVHQFHHQFYNPSPFAVIADEYLDQIVRALPLLVIPMVIPVNMDMLFAQCKCLFVVFWRLFFFNYF
jgi:lathosterol oxidase